MITRVNTTYGIEGEAEELILETGKFAKQAESSVTISIGGCLLLATVTTADAKEDQGFFPLQVFYNEKYYAAGKIPGGFIKREGKPKDREVLVSRLIDRPIRPLFPDGFKDEVQIIITTLSSDQKNPTDILAIIAASAALSISSIPWNGPVGATRVSYIDDKLILNPRFDRLDEAKLDLIVAGTDKAITMIEGDAHEVSEELMIKALSLAHDEIKRVCLLQNDLIEKSSKPKKEFNPPIRDEELYQQYKLFCGDDLKDALLDASDKLSRDKAMKEVFHKAEEHFADQWEEDEEKLKQLKSFPHELELEIVRNLILSENKRVDGRKFDELRPLSMEVALLPRTHGSSLFTRGETQSLSVITLGTELDEQRFDDIEGEGTTRFMLHYNFPPFSVGEVGRFGPPGRREIGHGRLAERALIPVLPNKEEFPYAIRVVSEILESNGSSSMATVCAGCLALKDAGVPLKSTIAGIAMGLVKDNETGEYRILTDIQGAEDHLGDMDFKVAGSKNGITAFQLDLKIEGVSPEIMAEALQQAKKARIEIIEKMNACIDQPRDYLSEYAPRIITFSVHPEQIGEIIGPGGKIIKEIQARTQAKVEVKDDGTVTIYSKDENAAMDAYQFVQSIISEVEVGTIYLGVVKRINEMGAFIEILPGKEALCRVSQISTKYVHRIEDVVSVGDEIEVKVVEVDSMGRINVAHPEYEWRPNPRQSRGGGGGGRSHGGGGRSRGGYSGRGGYR